MTFSLLSLQRFIDNNVTRLFNVIPSKAILNKLLPDGNQQQIGLMTVHKGQLTLDYSMAEAAPSTEAEVYSCQPTMSLLHRRLGHSGQAALQRLLSANMATWVQIVRGTGVEPCDACQLGKLTRPPHPPRPFLHNTTFPL